MSTERQQADNLDTLTFCNPIKMKVFLLVSSLLWGSKAFAPVPKVQSKPTGLHPTGSAFRYSFKSPSLKSFTLCATKENVALCFEGGGFLAFAVHSGLISGLLRSANAEGKSTSYDLAESKVLDRVETVVSNSGGTWFASELMYAPEFLQVIEEMAKIEPSRAAGIFKRKWTKPWIDQLAPDSELPSWLVKVIDYLINKITGNPGIVEDIRMLMYFWGTNEGLTWYNFVETLLQATAGMKSDLTLGSPVNSWCKGKSWIINTSIMSPSGKNQVYVWTGEVLNREQLKYTTRDHGLLHSDMSPTRFSVVLGEPTAEAPLPIAAQHVLTKNVLHYQGATNWFPSRTTKAETPGMLLQGPQADLNLPAAVACSSAFLAGLATSDEGAIVEKDLRRYAECSMSFHDTRPLLSHFPPLADSSTPVFVAANYTTAKAFPKGLGLVDKFRNSKKFDASAVDQMAADKLYGIADGGFTDNTGVVNALANNATELYVFLDRHVDKDDNYGVNGLLNLFKNGNKTYDAGIKGKAYYYQVFDMDITRAKQIVDDEFEALELPNQPQEIRNFKVGTIRTTTVTNKITGVRGGQNVNVNVFIVGARTSIGQLEDFNNYSTLVGEVIETMCLPANKDTMSSITGSLMDGSGNFPGGSNAKATPSVVEAV